MEQEQYEIVQWFRSQYVQHTNAASVDGGIRFKKITDKYPAVSNGENHSYGMVKMFNYLRIKYKIPISTNGYICASFSASIDNVTSKYAYMYWRRNGGSSEPEYICISSTYESRDGEWRNTFLRYSEFIASYEKNAEYIDLIERKILELIGSGFLQLDVNIFPEGASILSNDDNTRAAIIAFAYVLIKPIDDNVNKNFVKIVNLIREKSPEFDKIHTDWQFYRLCGQKITPMFSREITQLLDYNLATWRELQISQIVSDLVLNFISPSFAFYNQWTYIEGVNESLFENIPMKERFVRGVVADEAIKIIRESRKKINDAPSNYFVENLNTQLYNGIEYAQSYLSVSPIAILHLIEDVGLTIKSFHMRKSPINLRGPVMRKILFELIYGAHCLHTKVGIAHTDLHNNNYTIREYAIYENQKHNGFSHYIIYITGATEHDAFIFPNLYAFASIIDFSRSIVGPAFRSYLEEGRSKQYADNFYHDQINRTMRTLHRYSDVFVEKHQEILKGMIISNFEIIFPLLCAVDFIAIGRSLASVLRECDIIDDYMSNLLSKLEKMAYESYIGGLQKVVTAVQSHSKIDVPEFPGKKIIDALFETERFPTWAAANPTLLSDIKISDFYNYNNDMKYSCRDYSKYPPWAKVTEIEKHLGEFKLTDVLDCNIHDIEHFHETTVANPYPEIIAEQYKATISDDVPLVGTSSWIE